MKFKIFLFFILFTIHFSLFTVSHAAHPLITDDTGTQGKGKVQVEINSEYNYDKEKVYNKDEDKWETEKNTGTKVQAIISYGIVDNVDVIVGSPYQWKKKRTDGVVTSDVDGVSDMSLEVKWRFYEEDGLSLALKPGITLATGDEKKELGAGRTTYGMFFVATKEIESWAFHLNLGYKRNENKLNERRDIWHTSVAGELEVVKDIKLVANIGTERNPDRAFKTNPAFILGGIIYSVSENFDIDFGLKGGLNKPETDYSILAGVTFRFLK